VCRLLNFMDSDGYDVVVPQHPGDAVEERPLMEFMPGYVLRSLDQLPKQGSVKPWRLNANYLADLRLIRHGKIADGGLRFFKHPAGSVSPAQTPVMAEVLDSDGASREQGMVDRPPPWNTGEPQPETAALISQRKMGKDAMSVVDGQLKVYGTEHLRIADGSIMPRVTTGNTMAPCVIIGERAADILKAQHTL
jgi:choline dehydrogenase-like flavoprotein